MRSSALLLLLLWLVGCAARPTEPPPESPFVALAPTATARPADAPVEIIGHFTGDSAAPLLALLDGYRRAGGQAAHYEGNASLPTLLRERLRADQPPDILLLPVPTWLGELADAGAIVPLEGQASAAVRQHFDPAWVEVASHGGVLYGVPLDANAKSLLWYRPEAVPVPPQTLDELAALAARLEREGQAAFAVPGEPGWPLTDWFEAVLLAEGGEALYDDLLDHRVAWTDEAVQRAARRFTTLLQPAWLAGGRYDQPLRPELFAATFDRRDPQAALWLGQGSIVRGYARDLRLRPGEEIAVAPFPLGGALIGSGSVAVATNDRPATMALLAYLTQPEALGPWIESGALISPNRDVPLDRYPDPLTRREAEILRAATSFRYDLSDRLPTRFGPDGTLARHLAALLDDPTALDATLADLEAIATREQGRVQPP